MGGMGNGRFDQYTDGFNFSHGDEWTATSALDVTVADLLVSVVGLNNNYPGRF